jgi:hypothetical protein
MSATDQINLLCKQKPTPTWAKARSHKMSKDGQQTASSLVCRLASGFRGAKTAWGLQLMGKSALINLRSLLGRLPNLFRCFWGWNAATHIFACRIFARIAEIISERAEWENLRQFVDGILFRSLVVSCVWVSKETLFWAHPQSTVQWCSSGISTGSKRVVVNNTRVYLFCGCYAAAIETGGAFAAFARRTLKRFLLQSFNVSLFTLNHYWIPFYLSNCWTRDYGRITRKVWQRSLDHREPCPDSNLPKK